MFARSLRLFIRKAEVAAVTMNSKPMMPTDSQSLFIINLKDTEDLNNSFNVKNLIII